jgi:hypothetical protein
VSRSCAQIKQSIFHFIAISKLSIIRLSRSLFFFCQGTQIHWHVQIWSCLSRM